MILIGGLCGQNEEESSNLIGAATRDTCLPLSFSK
jgi:hypothetical protein